MVKWVSVGLVYHVEIKDFFSWYIFMSRITNEFIFFPFNHKLQRWVKAIYIHQFLFHTISLHMFFYLIGT